MKKRLYLHLYDRRREQFCTYVEKHKDRIFQLSYLLVNNKQIAEEISKEVLIEAYADFDSQRKGREDKILLYKQVIKHTLTILDQQVDEVNGSIMHVKMSVAKGLMNLAFEERAILILKHVCLLSISDISEVVGLPKPLVKERLIQARDILVLEIVNGPVIGVG
ncbi:hypothetical protein [Bacillus suaedae]|uniref:Uncharacterized protein n=1 Tax=Halalkalibacter suaedae TaxID=2822140 RepID=A0A941ATI3_9BACI|nr:hypothetical protein [Bacillus suaedae]MBP3951884.1 hypothetical protein [Bacillus suaedae]